jgi:SAM-dependent methyltransferase
VTMHCMGSRAALAQVEAAIQQASREGSLRVLDAGCGFLPAQIALPKEAHRTGIDTSQRQLDRNTDIQDKLLWDISTYPFSPEFDVVSCWDVLEHLPDPEVALANLVTALRPGGLLVVKVPNLESVKGLLTKLTPHRFHLWFYRRVYGYDEAGVDDHGPFRTYLRRTVTERGLRRFARQAGLSVALVARYESEHQERLRARLHVGGIPWRALDRAVRVLTLGFLTLADTELLVALRK